MADRGLLSLDNIGEITALPDQDGRKLEFILAVPARRDAELVETFQGLAFSEAALAETRFAGHRLIVAQDSERAALQSTHRRKRIAELEARADRMVARLDVQDTGEIARWRACLRPRRLRPLCPCRRRGRIHRFLKADYSAERFSYALDEAAIAQAELFDGEADSVPGCGVVSW